MSAYPEFNLLPPPPPTYLSTSSPRRAQLPRFANVDEVREFARGQVLARRSLSVKVSLFFVITYISLLGILASSVIIRRILNRKFWLFRIVRRRDGLLLVPHLHNTWSVLAGCFACLWTSYNIACLVDLVHQQPPKQAGYALIYVWGPLYVGVSWMAWAAAVAGTQNLFIRIKITRRWECSFFIQPWVANLVGIVVPCSCALSVFFPARLGNQHAEAARRLFLEWDHQFSTQETITEDMLIQLQLIWFQTIQHANYLAICAMMWSIFALISNLVYLYFSVRLIGTLGSHLRKGGPKAGPISNAMTMSMGIFSGESAPDGEEDHLDQVVQSKIAVQTIGGTSAIASSNIIRSQVAVTIEDTRSPCDKKQPTAGSSPASPVPPPSKPMTSPTCAQREGASSVSRAVLYFIIQAASLNIGTFLYLNVMFVSGIVTVAQTEQGHFLNTINICQMLLAFICVVFGTTTLVSIAHETYEESLASLIHPPRKSHPDTAPFQPSPVTISVLERRRRVPQEIQTREVQMELERQMEDESPTPGYQSSMTAQSYSYKQHSSINGDLLDREA